MWSATLYSSSCLYVLYFTRSSCSNIRLPILVTRRQKFYAADTMTLLFHKKRVPTEKHIYSACTTVVC
jgi:hypothetical protein